MVGGLSCSLQYRFNTIIISGRRIVRRGAVACGSGASAVWYDSTSPSPMPEMPCGSPAPPTTLSATRAIKALVSKKKLRLIEDGFNLDLSYITERIIAMGFPADRLQALYRNDADEVVSFLNQRHGDEFFVFNLCRERRYDARRFSGRVQWVPLRDHHPPPLHVIKPFCERAHSWLTSDSSHVIAVHCKAGKGRTGVMICCYLLHAGLASSPRQAMEIFGRRRTADGNGVTIPSQRQYVEYYHRLLKAESSGRMYRPVPLTVIAVELRRVHGWPALLEVELVSRDDAGEERVLATSPSRSRGDALTAAARLQLNDGLGVCVRGDVMLSVWGRRHALLPRERLGHVWFNTWLVADVPRDSSGKGTVKWLKPRLDVACRDDRISDTACVQIFFIGEGTTAASALVRAGGR